MPPCTKPVRLPRKGRRNTASTVGDRTACLSESNPSAEDEARTRGLIERKPPKEAWPTRGDS